MVNMKGEPGRTPNTLAPLMRGSAGGLGVRITALFRRRGNGFRAVAGIFDFSVGPIGMVVIDAVAGVVDHEAAEF